MDADLFNFLQQLDDPFLLTKAADKLPEPQRTIKLNAIRADLVKHGFYDKARHIAVTLLGGDELTADENAEIIANWLVDFHRWDDAVTLAKSLPEPQRATQLSILLAAVVKLAHIKSANEVAELLGRKLNSAELTIMLRKCMQNRWYDKAAQIASQLPEHQRSTELQAVIKALIEENRYAEARAIAQQYLL